MIVYRTDKPVLFPSDPSIPLEHKSVLVWRQKPSRRTVNVMSKRSLDVGMKSYFVSFPATYLFVGIKRYIYSRDNADLAGCSKVYVGFGESPTYPGLPDVLYTPPLPNVEYNGYVCLGESQCHSILNRPTDDELASEVAHEFFSVPFKLGEIDSSWAEYLQCNGEPDFFYALMDLWQRKTLKNPSWSLPMDGLYSSRASQLISSAMA